MIKNEINFEFITKGKYSLNELIVFMKIYWNVNYSDLQRVRIFEISDEKDNNLLFESRMSSKLATNQ